MKSKSLKDGEGKDFASDFINVYKKADETTVKLKAHEVLNDSSKTAKKVFKHRVKSPNKQNFKHNDGNENVIKPDLDNSELINNALSKEGKAVTKHITRNSGNKPDLSASKPKKRNKSVSFILDENEEVEVKRTKSKAFLMDSGSSKSAEITAPEKLGKKKSKKKHEKGDTAEKENTNTTAKSPNVEKNNKILNNSMQVSQENINSENNNTVKRKRNKELRQIHKGQEDTEQDAQALPKNKIEPNNVPEKKSKRRKKNHLSSEYVGENDANEGEPAKKSQRKDVIPEAVAEDLENLNIGDNTHTLTKLLDDMVVVDKKKLKKKKHNKNKSNQPLTSTINTDTEGSKLKEKWKKKRWNKDRKPFVVNKQLSSSVTVDNLPNRIILNYKKLLSEHFSKCGVIKNIGVAEIYLTDNPKPIFSTTISFDNEDAVLKALEEDNTSFEGNFIRVKKPLPPSKTTLVVRSYGEMTAHALSSAFNGAGRIRNIQIINKSKKTMGTAFIEFDGPAALDRAIQIAEDIKIGGKNIHSSKFRFQNRSKLDRAELSAVKENDDSSDSSND